MRVQDKGSRFAVISKDEYCEKVSTQIGRSSFTQLPHGITKSFENKVNDYGVLQNVSHILVVGAVQIVGYIAKCFTYTGSRNCSNSQMYCKMFHIYW